jgi:dTDP-4-dehydrorhamnose reductase
MTRVLILGGTGMLGHKLYQVFGRSFDSWATVRAIPRAAVDSGIFDPSRLISGVDALEGDSVVGAIEKVRPDVVVNAMGVVKQSSVIDDPIATVTVNALLPHQLAAACRASGVRLVHISTDCVFSGRKGMYTEADPADADDFYGRSKLLGEVTSPGCLTVRTSLIGRELATRRGLVAWLLGNQGRTVKGYTQAIFSGFPTLIFAEILAECISRHPALSGLHHISSDPINKFDLLCLVRDAYRIAVEIEPSVDVCVDRSLDSSRFRSATGFEPLSWPQMVARMAEDRTDFEIWRGYGSHG